MYTMSPSPKKSKYIFARIFIAVIFAINIIAGDSLCVVTKIEKDLDRRSDSASIKELNPETFILPAYLGTIKDVYNAESERIVIHIQDAHCNYAAQKKIAEIIDYFDKEYEARSINLEGGVKDYDLSIFSQMEERDIRNRIVDYYIREGLINGAEAYAANNPDRVKLWGLEDQGLYIDNLRVYRDSVAYKAEAEKYLNILKGILDGFKVSVYTPELLEFDKRYNAYKAGETDFKDYFMYLADKANATKVDIKDFVNIYLLYQSMEHEKTVDFKKANSQRDALIDRLQKSLSQRSLEDMVRRVVDFREDKITQYELFKYLLDKARLANIDTEGYPELKRYVAYISFYHRIDKSELMSEVSALENTLANKLYKNDTQRRLDMLSKNLTLTRNMLDIKLTKSDWEYYRTHKDEFGMKNYVEFIEREGPIQRISARPGDEVYKIDEYRQRIERFYDYSLKRDQVFLQNIVFAETGSGSQKQGRRIAVVVTGGFHAENLSELFREKGISYVSILPNFVNEKGYKSQYFEILAGKRTEFLSSLETAMYSLQVPSLFNALGWNIDHRASELARIGAIALEYGMDRIEKEGKSFAVKVIKDGLTGYLTIEYSKDSRQYEFKRVTGVDESRFEVVNNDNPVDINDTAQVEWGLAQIGHDYFVRDDSNHEYLRSDHPVIVEARLMIERIADASIKQALLTELTALTDNQYKKTIADRRGERRIKPSLISIVRGVKASRAGGHGIYLRRSDNPDEKLSTQDMAEDLVHELLAGIYGNSVDAHLLITMITEGLVAQGVVIDNEMLDRLKTFSFAKGDESKAVWNNMVTKELMKAERDYADGSGRPAQFNYVSPNIKLDQITLVKEGFRRAAEKKGYKFTHEQIETLIKIYSTVIATTPQDESKTPAEKMSAAAIVAQGKPKAKTPVEEMNAAADALRKEKLREEKIFWLPNPQNTAPSHAGDYMAIGDFLFNKVVSKHRYFPQWVPTILNIVGLKEVTPPVQLGPVAAPVAPGPIHPMDVALTPAENKKLNNDAARSGIKDVVPVRKMARRLAQTISDRYKQAGILADSKPDNHIAYAGLDKETDIYKLMDLGLAMDSSYAGWIDVKRQFFIVLVQGIRVMKVTYDKMIAKGLTQDQADIMYKLFVDSYFGKFIENGVAVEILGNPRMRNEILKLAESFRYPGYAGYAQIEDILNITFNPALELLHGNGKKITAASGRVIIAISKIRADVRETTRKIREEIDILKADVGKKQNAMAAAAKYTPQQVPSLEVELLKSQNALIAKEGQLNSLYNLERFVNMGASDEEFKANLEKLCPGLFERKSKYLLQNDTIRALILTGLAKLSLLGPEGLGIGKEAEIRVITNEDIKKKNREMRDNYIKPIVYNEYWEYFLEFLKLGLGSMAKGGVTKVYDTMLLKELVQNTKTCFDLFNTTTPYGNLLFPDRASYAMVAARLMKDLGIRDPAQAVMIVELIAECMEKTRAGMDVGMIENNIFRPGIRALYQANSGRYRMLGFDEAKFAKMIHDMFQEVRIYRDTKDWTFLALILGVEGEPDEQSKAKGLLNQIWERPNTVLKLVVSGDTYFRFRKDMNERLFIDTYNNFMKNEKNSQLRISLKRNVGDAYPIQIVSENDIRELALLLQDYRERRFQPFVDIEVFERLSGRRMNVQQGKSMEIVELPSGEQLIFEETLAPGQTSGKFITEFFSNFSIYRDEPQRQCDFLDKALLEGSAKYLFPPCFLTMEGKPVAMLQENYIEEGYESIDKLAANIAPSIIVQPVQGPPRQLPHRPFESPIAKGDTAMNRKLAKIASGEVALESIDSYLPQKIDVKADNYMLIVNMMVKADSRLLDLKKRLEDKLSRAGALDSVKQGDVKRLEAVTAMLPGDEREAMTMLLASILKEKGALSLEWQAVKGRMNIQDEDIAAMAQKKTIFDVLHLFHPEIVDGDNYTIAFHVGIPMPADHPTGSDPVRVGVPIEFFQGDWLSPRDFAEFIFHEIHGENLAGEGAGAEAHQALYRKIQERIFGSANPLAASIRQFIDFRGVMPSEALRTEPYMKEKSEADEKAAAALKKAVEARVAAVTAAGQNIEGKFNTTVAVIGIRSSIEARSPAQRAKQEMAREMRKKGYGLGVVTFEIVEGDPVATWNNYQQAMEQADRLLKESKDPRARIVSFAPQLLDQNGRPDAAMMLKDRTKPQELEMQSLAQLAARQFEGDPKVSIVFDAYQDLQFVDVALRTILAGHISYYLTSKEEKNDEGASLAIAEVVTLLGKTCIDIDEILKDARASKDIINYLLDHGFILRIRPIDFTTFKQWEDMTVAVGISL